MNGTRKKVTLRRAIRILRYRRSLAQGRAYALKGRRRRGNA